MYQELTYQSAEEALSVIQSGDRVFVQGSAQTPLYLLRELAKQSHRLHNVEMVFITVATLSPQFSLQFVVCFRQYPAGSE